VKRELERIEIPDEHGARERSWAVVSAAFAEREPQPRRRSWKPALALVGAAALVAAALTPPGRAVLDEVQDAVLPTRVERVERSLFSLPAQGRLLVVSAERGGVWIVRSDGSRRRLGDYSDARWSPFGNFVVATRPDRLVALTPAGEERWSLSRRNVGLAAWGGSRTDTRIAYTARGGLRIVDGDGTNDRGLAPDADLGPFAWRPGVRFQLAYLVAGELRLQDADSGGVLWRALAGSPFTPVGLSWSSDGERIAVVFERELVIFNGRGQKLRRVEFLRSDITSASFAPGGHLLGVLLRSPGAVTASTRASLRVVNADTGSRGRELFAGRGDFGELAWSPDGRYALVAWRSADRWLFVNRATRYAIAVENISRQFPRPDGRPPLIFVGDRWCCAG
jgi:hypothetical protein